MRHRQSPQAPDDLYPAPYGRACANCSQSKCKCILSRAGGRCQRCERLNRECRQPTFNRRQSGRRSTASQSSRLEEKLDDLLSLLRSDSGRSSVDSAAGDSAKLVIEQLERQHLGSQNHHLHTPPTEAYAGATRAALDSGYSFSNPSNTMALESDSNTRRSAASSLTGGTATTSSTSPAGLSSSSSELTSLQAEEYLSIFQTQMLPYFPCVHLPPGTTALQLKEDRPFLWHCIMAVSSRLGEQQRALCDTIKNLVAQEMVHGSSHCNIDILLGLLVYIGWSNQQVSNRANIAVFTQLAKAVVFDLGINKPAAKEKIIPLCVHTSHADEEEASAPPPVRTAEEARAVLGCFLITSIVASFLQQIDALRWTSHMDECLQMLEEGQECANDEVLVHLVRFQLINENVKSGAFWHGGTAAMPGPLLASPSFYLHAIESQLQSVKTKMEPYSQRYRILLLHYWSTALALNESALSKTPTASENLCFQRLERLYASVDSLKSWFDVFLAIPPGEYIGFPFCIFSQLVHNLVTLYQLSTLDEPAWDKAAVRRMADVLHILKCVVNNTAQVATLNKRDSSPEDDVFTNLSTRYESIRAGWEAKLGLNPMTPPPQLIQEPLDTSMDLPLVGDTNDWLADILKSMV